MKPEPQGPCVNEVEPEDIVAGSQMLTRGPCFVDSHAHIDGKEFDEDRAAVVERARAAGVRAILNVGTGDPGAGNFERAVAVAEQHEGVYAAAGVHPHDAALYTEEAERLLLSLANKGGRFIAWGEIGLDYYYDHSPRETQRKVFARQLRLAGEVGLPVIIHSREANEETIEILRAESKAGDLRGILHCFGGDRRMADDALELGFMISFAGNVTFKKADQLREVARHVPLDRLLCETDCPYLAPVPHRGRRNEPAYVAATAGFLAELRGMSATEMGRLTTGNFARFFGLDLFAAQQA